MQLKGFRRALEFSGPPAEPLRKVIGMGWHEIQTPAISGNVKDAGSDFTVFDGSIMLPGTGLGWA